MGKASDFHRRVGENPAKRLTLSFIFNRIIHNQNRYNNFQRILCMPGMSAWDIKFFLKRTKADITGIDIDQEVITHLKQLFKNEPRVHLFCTSTIKFFDQYTGPPFDLIYLDYFSGFTFAVEHDISTIFKNGILLSGRRTACGKLVVNLYGARIHTRHQIRHREHVREVCDVMEQIPPKKITIPIAFNCFLYKFKLLPYHLGRRTQQPSLFASTNAPRWFRYRTIKGQHMYTAYFGYRSKNTRRIGATSWHPAWITPKIQTIPYSVRGHFPTSDVNVKNYVLQLIHRFYEKHRYAPAKTDIVGSKYQSLGSWTKLIREAGYCPATNSTDQDVNNEIKRIKQREGYLDWSLLETAHISRKRPFNYFKSIVEQSTGNKNIGRSKSPNSPHDYLELLVLINKYLNGKANRTERLWLRKNHYTTQNCIQRLQDYISRIHPLRQANNLPTINVNLDLSITDRYAKPFSGREEKQQIRYQQIINLYKKNPNLTHKEVAEKIYGSPTITSPVSRLKSRAQREGYLP